VAIDLNDLVKATAELRGYHLQQINVTLTLRCAPRALPVLVNREEIRQVILNLLLNAEHAIASSAGGGEITIHTTGNGVSQVLEVTDSGPGISPDLRGRIFEPFFTTREVGEGTGLGLSISHGIALSHHGSLTLADSPVGARFRLTLPAYAHATVGATTTDGSGLRALVVDDDESIRKLLVRLLEKRGFEVLEAETGEEAMALALAQRPGIVICDTAVPGITGLDLYRQLAARDAAGAPRFVFISGEKAPAGQPLAGVPVLAKPFTSSDLEMALVEAGIAAPRLS
jgi:two-component system NtrC family sensor kinase